MDRKGGSVPCVHAACAMSAGAEQGQTLGELLFHCVHASGAIARQHEAISITVGKISVMVLLCHSSE